MFTFNTDDTIVKLAIFTAFLVMGVTVSVGFLILTIRISLVVRQQHSNHFLEVWRPILAESLESVPNNLPTLYKKDYLIFLNLWNYYQESLRGDVVEKLNQIAYMLGIEKVAMQYLRKGNVSSRLLAIVTLGHLQEKSVWEELRNIAMGSNPFLSLAAAKAMVDINTNAALVLLMPLISERSDWSTVTIANILKKAEPEVVSKHLSAVIFETSERNIPKLIRYMEAIRSNLLSATVKKILQTSTDAEVISTCLRVLNSPEDLETVRFYIDHPTWHVRLQSAAALGRIGTNEDISRLSGLLSDKEWWVRYRAAQALSNLPLMTISDLEEIYAEQTDRYARNILEQAIAEKKKKS